MRPADGSKSPAYPPVVRLTDSWTVSVPARVHGSPTASAMTGNPRSNSALMRLPQAGSSDHDRIVNGASVPPTLATADDSTYEAGRSARKKAENLAASPSRPVA